MSDWPVPPQYQPLALTIGDSPYSVPAGVSLFIGAASSAGSDFTLNLPPATGSGYQVTVKKTDSNPHNILVTPSGTDTIDGVNAAKAIPIQAESLTFLDNASGAWALI